MSSPPDCPPSLRDKPLLEWSTEDCVAWLATLGRKIAEEAVPKFRDFGINGKNLRLFLSDQTLLNELELSRLVRTQILSALEELVVLDCPRMTQDELELDLRNPLGEGQFGEVFRGFWKTGGVQVVVKRLKDRAQFQKLCAEAGTLEKVSRHPHMVRLLGLCVDRGHEAMVLEYLPNGSLEDYVISKSNLQRREDMPQLIKMLAQIATALHFLHSQQPEPILHRDIACRNVLLDAHLDAKLADLGLAAVSVGKRHYGVRGELLPVWWTAPEALGSSRRSSPASDVWMFSMTAHELVSRRRPFSEYILSTSEFVHALLHPEQQPGKAPLRPQPLAESQCPAALRKLIERGWDETPEKRPTMGEIAAELHRLHVELAEYGYGSYHEVENNDSKINSSGASRGSFLRPAASVPKRASQSQPEQQQEKQQQQQQLQQQQRPSLSRLSSERLSISSSSSITSSLADSISVMSLAPSERVSAEDADKIERMMHASRLYGQQRFPEAVSVARQLGEDHPVAAAFLGYCTLWGRGVEENKDVGKRKLAENAPKLTYWSSEPQCDPTAQWLLAWAHYGGWGVPRDQKRMLHLLKRAAKRAHSPALWDLAGTFLNGVGESGKDLKKALRLLDLAANQGHESAKTQAALLREKLTTVSSRKGDK